ncbi:MAG: transposase, partial [Bacteroidota bacterium]
CFKAQTDHRTIKVSHRARRYRQQAKDRLDSLKGRRKKIQRNIDVEAVFGHIKQDRAFRRFMLTGLDGVNIEMGLLAIANNFTKWHNLRVAKRIPMPGPHPNSPNTAQIATESGYKPLNKAA